MMIKKSRKVDFKYLVVFLFINISCFSKGQNDTISSINDLNNSNINYHIVKINPLFQDGKFIVNRYRVLIRNITFSNTVFSKKKIKKYFKDINKDWAFNLYLYWINGLNASSLLNHDISSWRKERKNKDMENWIQFPSKIQKKTK